MRVQIIHGKFHKRLPKQDDEKFPHTEPFKSGEEVDVPDKVGKRLTKLNKGIPNSITAKEVIGPGAPARTRKAVNE